MDSEKNINTIQEQLEDTAIIPPSPKTNIGKRRKLLWLVASISVFLLGTVYVFFVRSSDTPKQSEAIIQQEATNISASTADVPDAIKPVDPRAVPLGDGNISKSPKVGNVYSCQTSFNGGGADTAGPWLNAAAKTWDTTQKVSVSGSVAWPAAAYKTEIAGDKRLITGNNLPIGEQRTGVYPIQKTDTAYKYDKNPNSIAEQKISLSLPVMPSIASQSSCVGMGAIGILKDGVVLFNALDGQGRDAAAHETLDVCDGHPEMTKQYHHHNIPSCFLSKYTTANTSTLVGYANDGFGIYVERDKNGDLLTNANLDECHGRISKVVWDGTYVDMYHYVATIEYPYVVGCFKGTAASSTKMPANSGMQPPPSR